MEGGSASYTARRVAAHRLDYQRIEAPYGDPAADLALAADIADGLQVPDSRMHDYLRARTAFFDRVVVTSIDHGITQIVVGGAGYDGRAFRYAKPGVRWFEVDHPATQADKLDRIGALGIDARHVRFVAADFRTDPVAGPLADAGLDPARPALFLLEGVAVYLDEAVIGRVLRQFREVTVDGGLLAISMSLAVAGKPARERFRASVAAHGEPARSSFTPRTADQLLAGEGWQVTEGRDRLRSAGLLLARATGTSFSYPERVPLALRPTRTPSGAPARSGAPAVDVAGPLPLSALLSQALVAFTIECDNEAEHLLPHRTATHGLRPGAPADAPWLTSLAMWATCLRFLPDDGITGRGLRRLARTGTTLDGVRRWGLVTFSPAPAHGKRPAQDALIRPTAAGSQARDVWREVPGVVEDRWRDRFGAAAVDPLRSALAAIVTDLDPALPDCLPILHHGLYTRPDPPAPPAAAVPPTAPAPLALPLWALLSKPLLTFATEFEQDSDLSLAISADVVRVLPAAGDALRPRDIPALSGVSKESIAMALGVLRTGGHVAEDPDPAAARGKVIRLTERGAAAQRTYHRLTAEVEERWRARFGPGRVDALRASLEPLAHGDPPPLLSGLVPYPDNWRATLRPPSLLPHYPMVLHRGGFPDGS
jgi:methyltransferase (TIGR00027 family)